MLRNIFGHHKNFLTSKSAVLLKSFHQHLSSQSVVRELPKCIYVQPPVQWLMCKLRFQRLKAWDRSFNEKEFKKGAQQATLMLMDIVRMRDSVFLSKVSTLKGFSQIYKDMLHSEKDPRRKLLYFNVEDIKKIVPVDIQLIEDNKKCICNVEVFFMCMRYLDEVIQSYKENSKKKSTLVIHQDIRNVENLLKKGRKGEQQKILPPSEKVIYLEGYLRLYSSFSLENFGMNEWRIDFFKFSNFDIVPIVMKAAKK